MSRNSSEPAVDPYYDEEDEVEFKQERTFEKGELARLRSNLFEIGSSFRPTYRHEIVGIDNVLEEIDLVIHWLQNSDVYQEYESRLEPGVIFEGEPGTGKSMMSRYIATASEALFINVRDWPHENSLFTDNDIRELFTKAREAYARTQKPIVLFWDEFETSAKERGHGSTPEQAQAVSQLTAELDGIQGKNEGILLIGCTNYMYNIDHALRRHGRMGLHIEFHAPDREGKKIILEHYLQGTITEGNIDPDNLSYFFESDDTAADIEEACVEAWRYAVRRVVGKGNSPALNQDDLIEVFLKRLVGPPIPFMKLPEEDRLKIAVHEVGHALIACIYGVPLRLITVQPGKKTLGRTITAEVKEHIATYGDLVNDIRISIGSMAAHAVAGMDGVSGASSDVQRANQVACELIDNLEYGENTGLFNIKVVASSRTGSRSESASPNISDHVVKGIDFDMKGLLDQVEFETIRVMQMIGHDRLWEISRRVNEKVTLTGDQFKELISEVLETDDFSRFQH